MALPYVLTFSTEQGSHDLVYHDDTAQISSEVLAEAGLGTVLPSIFAVNIESDQFPLLPGLQEVSDQGQVASLVWEMGDSQAWKMGNRFFSQGSAVAVDEVILQGQTQVGSFTFAASEVSRPWNLNVIVTPQVGALLGPVNLFADGVFYQQLDFDTQIDLSLNASTLSWVLSLTEGSKAGVKLTWGFED